MAYMEQLQSGFKYMVQAGEAGRRNLDGMLGPVNGAISELTGAAGELSNLPFVGPAVGAKLQRVMGGINMAQSKIGSVLNTYSSASRALSTIDQRVGVLKEQAATASAAINKVVGKVSPGLASMLPTATFGTSATPLPEAVKPFPHLLILQPPTPSAVPFYFNLDTAAFDELRRQTEYRWASQERLTRRAAQQGVGIGDDKLSLKGAIFPGWRGGLKQLDTLRAIAEKLEALNLTTGYGQVLGTWCLARIEEEQEALMAGGIPRKQGFTLEFVRYGDDMSNV